MSNSRQGMSHTRLYRIWSQMIQRCHNPKSTGYAKYGEKGIAVCDAWHEAYQFMGWALLNGYRDNLTVERINHKLGYYPENCTWIPLADQAMNQGKKVTNTSGFVGVSFHKGTGKWAARVSVSGKRMQLGRFETAEEANTVRKQYFIDNNLTEHLRVYELQHSGS